MNSQVKPLWIFALRSGEYRQGVAALKVKLGAGAGFGHCCLGVLCELYARHTGSGAWEGMTKLSFYGCEYMPPDTVLDWARLDTETASELAGMNDKGYTFLDIAKFIEEKL